MDKFPSRERAATAVLGPRVSAVVAASSARRGAAAQSPFDLCLQSLMAEPCVDEIVIVDRGADAKLSSRLRALQADRRDVRIADASGAPSLAAALNLGAEQAAGAHLLFVDPHVVLRRGAAERLRCAGAAGEIWIAGGRLTGADGRERQHVRPGALDTWTAIAAALDWPDGKRARKTAARGEVGAVSSMLMLTPRNAFEHLGGFDTGYATDGADLDLCRRAKLAGGRVVFEPDAAGIQFIGAQTRRKPAQGLARFAGKSARTPLERAFALVARPALATMMALKWAVFGRPPRRR